jgi:hypothetical protein
MVLIAAGGFFGNLPDMLRYHDWPPSEMRDLFSTVALLAVCGAIFLTVAYGLFQNRKWASPVTLAVSALALCVLLAAGAQEGYDPAGAILLVAFYGTPLVFTSVWAFIDLMRQRKLRTSETRGGQLA